MNGASWLVLSPRHATFDMATRELHPTQKPSVVVDAARLEDPLIGSRINSIELVKRLDAGGMGTIYVGIHRELDKQYAVKVSTEAEGATLQGRSLQEAKALSKLDHPNIVQVFDACTLPDGRLAIVMPLLSGESLQRRIDPQPDGSSRPLPLREVVLLALQLVSGLQEAHRLGFVHRDLKPGNVFVTKREVELAGFKVFEVKLLDFGLVRTSRSISKLERLAGAPAGSTPGGTIAAGTPEYVSPEQANGSPTIDGRADLYSLGALLFQLVAGRLPFIPPPGLSRDQEAMSLVQQHERAPAPRLSTCARGVPPLLDELVAKLLEKSPENRPPTAKVVEGQLREILAALPAENAPRRAARGRLVALAVLVPCVAGGLAWLALRAPERPPVEVMRPPELPPAPVQATPPPPVATPEPALVVTPGEVVVTPVAPPVAKVAPKKPPRAHVPAEPCTPDERWRKTVLANLKELGRLAQDDPEHYSKFKAGEARVSSLVQRATSPAQCGQANALFEELKNALIPR